MFRQRVKINSDRCCRVPVEQNKSATSESVRVLIAATEGER
jgi:hypothetical protein